MKETTWWDKKYGQERPIIAYFSAEYGLAECLPIYSGGLGVLSGDHLKTASDLGIPLIGVGLLYQQGYFRQYLTPDGWQQERYPANDFYNLPLHPVLTAGGQPLYVELRLAGARLKIKVWKLQVGRVPLYLMDTNIPENPRELQDITDQLYGGDRETRIRQELVLGRGGVHALLAMGIRPTVYHMNEGHSAFLALERVHTYMQEAGVSFREALEAVRAGSVFTTHTPVLAGFDLFAPELMEKYFGDYLQEARISRDELLALGRANASDPREAFNMAVLALRTSAYTNGVSKLHGQVSRGLFQKYYPQVPEQEVPITSITNGIHLRSWISNEMATLYDRYLGPEWWSRPAEAWIWERVADIPDEELWATHERRRQRMIAIIRRRLYAQLERRGAPPAELRKARGVLDTDALTIGFARRFATYKRATLLLADLERLMKILLNSSMPVQFVFAGKAHPRDAEGKEFIKNLVAACQQEELRRHMVFLEDYDIQLARYLVHGVDIWLNNPRRPLEASGTSGMKVLANGGLNLSILDGWWAEGYRPEAGWAIGAGEEYQDTGHQDYVESNALYNMLESEVVPLFYQRDEDGAAARLARQDEKLHAPAVPRVQLQPHAARVLRALLSADRPLRRPHDGQQPAARPGTGPVENQLAAELVPGLLPEPGSAGRGHAQRGPGRGSEGRRAPGSDRPEGRQRRALLRPARPRTADHPGSHRADEVAVLSGRYPLLHGRDSL